MIAPFLYLISHSEYLDSTGITHQQASFQRFAATRPKQGQVSPYLSRETQCIIKMLLFISLAVMHKLTADCEKLIAPLLNHE